MCRNIKTLFNFDPPVTEDEVAAISTRLLRSLETTTPPKNREQEAAKAKARAVERFGAA